jgi:hypothetical protein
MQYTKEVNNMISTALTGAFGFSTAGLLLSTLLTFIAARPLLDMSLASAPPLANLIETSRFVRIMVEHQDIWFALPACLLLLMGFLGAEPDE